MAGLSHLSAIATQTTNTTGHLDPILEVDPEDGTLLKVRNHVGQGKTKGIPIIAKLKDVNGNPLPADTKLIFRVVRPTDESPVAVSVKEDNIASWNGLTTAEQRNEENIDAVKVVLKGGSINIRDKDTLRVDVKSSAQIDWANSELYFVNEGVDIVPFDG